MQLDYIEIKPKSPNSTWNGNLKKHHVFPFKTKIKTHTMSIINVQMMAEVVPQETGLLTLSGLRLADSLLSRTYPVTDLGQVYVVKEDQQFSALNAKVDNACLA